MGKVKVTKRDGYKTQYSFICPGCNVDHTISEEWDFNGDIDRPTFEPSILATGGKYQPDGSYKKFKCHSYVREGNIKFLNDSTHSKAGKTVALPEFTEDQTQ